MDRLSREREDGTAHASGRPSRRPSPVRPGRWSGRPRWATRPWHGSPARRCEPELAEEAPEAEAEEAPPAEMEQLEAQGIGTDALAGLGAVDDMAEGDLPE